MNKEVKQIFDIIKRGDPDRLLGDGLIKNIAEIICGAGYKNAEEVRKDTAREILTEFYKYLPVIGQLPNTLLNDLAKMVQELAEQYGVEVEQ